MLDFKAILSFSPLVYDAYCEAFPENERRNKKQFLSLFENPKAGVFSLQHDDRAKGYMVIWQLSGFVFMEHFEIFPAYRNQNMGTIIALSELVGKYPRIVLESEPETFDGMSGRRIGFYQRNGFSIIDKDYVQPAYSSDKSALNLFFVSKLATF